MNPVNTNWQKCYNKLGGLRMAEQGDPLPEKDPVKVAKENKIKEVCLNCKKKKCSGGRSCFERERKKMNDKD